MATFGQRIAQRLQLDGPTPRDDGGMGPHWRLDYLFALGATSWLVHTIVTLLATIVLLRSEDWTWPLPWFAVMTVIAVTMMLLGARYRTVHPTGAVADRYGKAHMVLTAIAGVHWGVGAFLAARGDSETLTFFTLVLGGTALGAVSSQHVYLRSCMSAIWTSIPLLTLAYFTSGEGASGVATGLMMFLFGGVLTILALRLHRFVSRNVAISAELADKIATLERTTAQLREAHSEKSRFLAQASHDLRQPIHAIGLFVECLDGMRLGREGRQILRNIELSVESLARLCRSLLDLSALDVGKVKPNVEPVALGDVMAEVVRQATGTARQRGIELRLVPTRQWVETDGALLHTMIQNLVSNAVKYAPGSRVLVGARRIDGSLCVDVVDTGPGIAPQDRNAIFQEFVQLGADDGSEREGLGLGLSIVRRLALLLRLTIQLDSEIGRGSCFRIAGLKPTAAGLSSREIASVPSHADRLRGLRVLVIDDDADVLESTVRVLSRWGCSVRATGRVAEVHQIEEAFDFVLCDYELGNGMTGDKVLEHLRRGDGQTSRPRAAIFTGADSDMVRSRVAAEGVTVLAKPVRPAQLRSVLLSARLN